MLFTSVVSWAWPDFLAELCGSPLLADDLYAATVNKGKICKVNDRRHLQF
jgi:hypothetical protein